MGKFPVTIEKERALEKRMDELGLNESDLEEKFIRGSGKGGQKINKTASCVYLKHLPTGLEIKCQQTRSQTLNRYYARKALCEHVEETIEGQKSKKQEEIEKRRRQKRKRSKRAKEKILEKKKQRSNIKVQRKNIDPSSSE